MAKQRDIYVFLSDKNRNYYTAVQNPVGDYIVSSSSQPYPLKFNPKNLLTSKVEFGTNANYFSMFRNLNYPLEFVKDGAAILRHFYFLGKGMVENCYVTVIEFNGVSNVYELSNYSKVDFSQKNEDPKSGMFTVPTTDDSIWGILSQRDGVDYSIECNESNPLAVPVLVDGIVLRNVITYQTLSTPLVLTGGIKNVSNIPMVLVNQEGDSTGLIIKSNQENAINDPIIPDVHSGFFESMYNISGINVKGNYMFQFNPTRAGANIFRIYLFFRGGNITSSSPKPVFNTGFPTNGQTYALYDRQRDGNIQPNTILNMPFDIDVDFTLPDIEMFFIVWTGLGSGDSLSISAVTSDVKVTVKSRMQPVIRYGLRPLDLLRAIISKATDGRYTINSNFFSANDKVILFSGDSLRGDSNAKLYTSFKDWWKSFNSRYFTAMRVINGDLFVEQAKEVYNVRNQMIDLGEIIDLKLSCANDFFANEILQGCPKQDLRHPSGRLEFNTQNTWSLPIPNISKKLDLTSKYRWGCFDATFLIMDYLEQSTKDNNGDKSVYGIEITNLKGSAVQQVPNFQEFTVDNVLLEPVIKTPLDNDTVNNASPFLSGVSQPISQVNIYIDGELDGTTVSDISGNWFYQILAVLSSYDPLISDGIHLIQATYTDLIAPTSDLTIVVDTTVQTATTITYPLVNQTLYNNLPFLKGTAPAGTNVNIVLDGVALATVIADNSGLWQYKIVIPLANGNRTLSINGVYTTNFAVNTSVSHPLITYIGSELDGFVIVNNLPLIQGIAQPNEVVKLYLNYIPYVPLGTVTADANGNWSYQVVPISYPDPVTGVPITIAPIQNGLNILSTDLAILNVDVSVSGYLINRPNFSLITGVPDNTVFNTNLSPLVSLIEHFPMLAAIMDKQRSDFVKFETSAQNRNLRRILNGVDLDEDKNIPASSLGTPIAILEYALIKTKADRSINEVLQDFNNGGYIKGNYRGTDLFFLPIGQMKMNNIRSDVQEWKLLLAPINNYNTLLNLYKNGLTINIMRNAVYRSDYNTLHFVRYNFQLNNKYNCKTIYDDWFSNRNDAWALNPRYTQKVQKDDPFVDQIISDGLKDVSLRMYRCSDAVLVDTIPYLPVSSSPLQSSYSLLECKPVLSNYPDDVYFFVMSCLANAASGDLVSPFKENPGDIAFKFSLAGVAIKGQTVTIELIVNGIYNYLYTSTIKAGWSIIDILNDLKAQVLLNTAWVDRANITTDDDGNLALLIESDSASAFDGNIIIENKVELNVAISERIDLRTKHKGTILIEAASSLNQFGYYFSTGAKCVVRVEGLVKKVQPHIDTVVAEFENADNELIYAQVSRKRTIRFGTAYGLPDYIYLKIAEALGLDMLSIENVAYVLDKDEKITASDDVEGHPLYYYNVNLTFADNAKGVVFSGGFDSKTDSVVLVTDATAFGMPSGSLVTINLD